MVQISADSVITHAIADVIVILSLGMARRGCHYVMKVTPVLETKSHSWVSAKSGCRLRKLALAVSSFLAGLMNERWWLVFFGHDSDGGFSLSMLLRGRCPIVQGIGLERGSCQEKANHDLLSLFSRRSMMSRQSTQRFRARNCYSVFHFPPCLTSIWVIGWICHNVDCVLPTSVT